MAQKSSKQRAEAEVLDLKSKLRQLNKAVAEKGASLEENAPLVDTIKAVEGMSNELTVSNGADVIYIDRPSMFFSWGMTSFKTKIKVKEDYGKKDLSRTFGLCTRMNRLPEIEGLEGATNMTAFVLGCGTLKEIALPDLPEATSLYLFAKECRVLKRATIGAMTKCSAISEAFKACTHLERVTIGDCPRVNNMIRAFEGCSSLERVTIDLSNNSERKSMTRTFFGCSSLRTITGIIACPDRGALTANQAFDGCTSLEEVRIKGLNGDLDLSDCAKLSVESVKYLVDNLNQVKGKSITLPRAWQTAHTEEASEYSQKAAAKGFTLNFR